MNTLSSSRFDVLPALKSRPNNKPVCGKTGLTRFPAMHLYLGLFRRFRRPLPVVPRTVHGGLDKFVVQDRAASSLAPCQADSSVSRSLPSHPEYRFSWLYISVVFFLNLNCAFHSPFSEDSYSYTSRLFSWKGYIANRCAIRERIWMILFHVLLY